MKPEQNLDEVLNEYQLSLNWLESNTVTRDDLDQINSSLNYVIKILQEIRGERVFAFGFQAKRAKKLAKTKK